MCTVATGVIRVMARASERAWRVVSSPGRRLPDFLIIGAQKSSTSSLYEHLINHPDIGRAKQKEIHYFDNRHHLGSAWYRSNFPLNAPRRGDERPRLCGEATPDYIFHPAAAARAAALVPDAKCIAVLRNPIDRAHSNHQHEVAHGREPLSFTEAIDQEPERAGADLERARADPAAFEQSIMHRSYLGRSRYVEQLEEWLRHYPRAQVLVLQAERLFTDPAGTMSAAWEFLGLPPGGPEAYPHANSRSYSPLDREVRARLAEYFEPYNERLFSLLGERFDW